MAEENKKSETMPKELMGLLDYYLVKKAPFQIPENGKEWIVKFGPWITLLLLILSLPALLFVFGIGAALTPFAGYGYASAFGVATFVLIVQIALQAMALPGLFARKMTGWTLIFYADVVNFVYSIVQGQYLSALLGALIGFYILFQIRGKYTK